MEPRVGPSDALDPGGSVNVGDGRYGRIQHPEGEQHVAGETGIAIEVVSEVLFPADGGERPPQFAALGRIDHVANRLVHRMGNDRPIAEGPRADLGPSSEQAEDLALRDRAGDELLRGFGTELNLAYGARRRS